MSFSTVGMEHRSCAIDIRGVLKSYHFSNHGRGKILYSEFISAKFTYSNARVSFTAMRVEHQTRSIDIYV